MNDGAPFAVQARTQLRRALWGTWLAGSMLAVGCSAGSHEQSGSAGIWTPGQPDARVIGDAATEPPALQGDGAAAAQPSAAGADGGEHGSAASGADGAVATNMPVPSVDPARFSGLASCSGSLADLFSKTVIMPPAEGSGVFHAVPAEQFAALKSALSALVRGDVGTAQSAASTARYELCRADDEGSLVIVARPQQSGQGHAVIAWRVAPERTLIAEAPHAWHDASTDIQSLEVFLGLKTRALILSGIYRCSSVKASPCGDGNTTACAAWSLSLYGPYTESDAAHNTEMFFQAAHEALSDAFSEDHVISFHGMPDPGVSISNATISDAIPGPSSLHVRLVTALQSAFPSEQITSCQKYDGAPYADRWCASENVQARYTLGSADLCSKGATTTNDRFVHMEQSKTVRAQRATVLAALRVALDAK